MAKLFSIICVYGYSTFQRNYGVNFVIIINVTLGIRNEKHEKEMLHFLCTG